MESSTKTQTKARNFLSLILKTLLQLVILLVRVYFLGSIEGL